VDRAFSITGSGTVVTGTLPAGTVRRGEELILTPALRPVRVRALQSLGENAAELTGVARAALNLRGIDRADVARGMALVQPGRWRLARQVDVRIRRESENGLPRLITLHVGSARTQAKVRMLGGAIARLALRDPLPLHVADRVLLRDPGASREQADPDGGRDAWPGIFGAVVLDVDPPALTRRGAAAAAAAELGAWPERPAAANLVRRRGLVAAADLTAMGVTDQPEPVAAGWLADPEHWAGLAGRLASIVAEQAEREPLAPGLSAEAAREALRLPDRRLVLALASAAPSVTASAGVLTAGTRPDSLPPALAAAVASLLAGLADRPFDAPDAARLSELGLDKRDLAAAARHGALERLTDQIVLAPGAGERAAQILAGLDQPFTAAAARVALGSTRRTVIPLLEHLDRLRLTQRLPDDRRRIRG
jgi:selenocysteine-specific elongation factor